MNKVSIINRKGSTEVFLNNTRLTGVREVEIIPIVSEGDRKVILGTEVEIRLTVDELEVTNESR